MLKAILKFISPARRPEDDYAAGAGWVYAQVRLEARKPDDVWMSIAYQRKNINWEQGAYAMLNDLMSAGVQNANTR